jgi:O-antigen/teichoic acid export membrane protein
LNSPANPTPAAAGGRFSGLSPASWVAAQNLINQAFGLILFAIQAPLLGPRAFGLIALVMVFIGFCEYVLEISATDALISVRDIDAQHYSTMTTVNALIAVVLGAAVLLCAQAIAGLFHEPELEPILRVMAALPLVSALASAPNAASRRDLQFRPLALRVLAGTLIGGAAGLTLTVLHFGVWALVWQTIVQRIVNVALLWKLVAMPFRVGFSGRHFRELWRYGAPMLLSQTMTWSATQIPRFLLGLYLGAAELGLFSLAGRINEIVLQVTLSPMFAVARVQMRAFIDDRSGLSGAMNHLLKQMGLLCFPLCIGGAVVMPVLFHVWLDARWSAGVLTAQLMLLGAMPYAAHYALSAALLAMNKQSLVAVNSTVQSIATVIVVAIFAPFGLNAAAAAIALRPLATAAIPIAFAQRHLGLEASGVWRAQAEVFLAAAAMGAIVYLTKLALERYLNPPALLAVMVLAGGVAYGLLIMRILPSETAALAARLRRKSAA